MVHWCYNVHPFMWLSTILRWKWCEFICSNNSRWIWIWFTILGWDFWLSKRFHITFDVPRSRTTIYLSSSISSSMVISRYLFSFHYTLFSLPTSFSFISSILQYFFSNMHFSPLSIISSLFSQWSHFRF